MRADFYQLAGLAPETAIPPLARKVLASGARLLVVAGDAAQRNALSKALWAVEPPAFLGNGMGDAPHAARQPILIGDNPEAANDAAMVMFADGIWREEAAKFERAFLLFDEATLAGARAAWRALGEDAGAERHFWKREGRGWVEGP